MVTWSGSWRASVVCSRSARRGPLPDLEVVAEWLAAGLPDSPAPTVVHGDYRLGNVMFAPGPRAGAILDWEMATIGDPLADLGYMTAMWSQPSDPPNAVSDLSAVTRANGFPDRAFLARRYAAASGRAVADLHWYQCWPCGRPRSSSRASYRRFGAGTTADPFFAGLERAVPASPPSPGRAPRRPADPADPFAVRSG